MMRTGARGTKATTVPAWRLKSGTTRPKRLSQNALEQPQTPMRCCDAATLNVHGCRTTSDSGSASAAHGWDFEAGGGRVIDKLRGPRPGQVSWSHPTTLAMARPPRGGIGGRIGSNARETRRARGS
jgi:hypothetical protein